MFQFSRWSHILCGLCACALLVSTAWAQPATYTKMSQDGTPIPDVNKVVPPIPGDSSCWLASASNILAAAGYGMGGNTNPAQLRAQGIYNQLTAAYGVMSGGAPDQAISYWLAWHGKNPNSPDYQPTLAYTDVTARYTTLTQADYNFLKNELYRCQYVGVQFDSPPHAVTFVGWDDNLGRSTWTDSDRTIGMNGYDSYTNSFVPNWNLNDIATGLTYLSTANGYVTFCPGLNKDPALVANYDVAWAPSPTGPKAREAGVKVGVFDPVPGWQLQAPWVDPANPNVILDRFLIDNEFDPERQKHIQLLVDYHDRDANYLNEDVRLRYFDEFGMEVIALPTKELSVDNGQVLFSWELDIQPAWEEILFPSYVNYGLLEGTVASWDVAVICVPEPGTLAMLVVVGLGLLFYARRRR